MTILAAFDFRGLMLYLQEKELYLGRRGFKKKIEKTHIIGTRLNNIE